MSLNEDITCYVIGDILYVIYMYITFTKHENPLFFHHYCVGHGADIEFHIKSGGGGGPRFRDNDTWSSCHKNLFSTLWRLDKNFMSDIVDVIALERFRIVTHSNATSFSRKVILCETNNIFYSQEYRVWHKDDNRFWKIFKNKGDVTGDSFRNFAYVSSYLHLKTFAWKRDYVISPKVQMPQTSLRPF